jgi:hypothetical protein
MDLRLIAGYTVTQQTRRSVPLKIDKPADSQEFDTFAASKYFLTAFA